jgi:small subunit ribosomal protein S4
MHRRTKRTSYIPFLLNPERRLDVILVRLHFCETLPQARQPISHRKVCVNNSIVNISHFQLSPGDIISFQEDYARTHGEDIRRFFYIKISVEKIIGKLRRVRKRVKNKLQISKTEWLRQVRMWRRRQIEWLRRLKTKKGCLLLLKDKVRFLQELHSSMVDFESIKKIRSVHYCWKMKRNFNHILRDYEGVPHIVNLSIRSGRLISHEILLKYDFYEEFYPHILRSMKELFLRKKRMKRRIKRIELPTHYSEVNYRTLKAVVSYGPNIDHIPHDIRLKDPNLP